MPIYAYRCSSCGHAKDVLRKISDPPLSTCPACGAESFTKQVTAAGFQLKGSGWYVTDFKGGGAAAAPAVAGNESGGADKGGADKPAADKSGGDKSGGDKSGGGSTPAAGSGDGGSSSSSSTPSTSAASASCGGSCACH
jgi:putative FmdB family regulatory protein